MCIIFVLPPIVAVGIAGSCDELWYSSISRDKVFLLRLGIGIGFRWGELKTARLLDGRWLVEDTPADLAGLKGSAA